MKPDHEKHMTYYKLLDYFKVSHCPICSAEVDTCRRYFEAVTGEEWNDPDVRNELIQSKGYCQRHAQYLMLAGDPLERAILYQDQVKLFLEFLDEAKKDKTSIHKSLDKWSQRALCPACKSEQIAAGRYLAVFMENMHENEFMNVFGSSPGLCITHFIDLLKSAPKDFPAVLIDMQLAKMRELARELEEFSRKHDYRFNREKFGKEGDSWKRAIEMVNGFLDLYENVKAAGITKPERIIKGHFKAGQVQEMHVMPKSKKVTNKAKT
jgi:hypothetical protein